MPDSPRNQLLASLAQSKLLSDAEYSNSAELVSTLPEDYTLEQMGDFLADRGYLTPWQARRIVSGEVAFWLGNYKLIDCIGQGGMGAVFKAEHTVMGRTVALKVLSKARLSNPRALARFQREVRAAAQLDHPNIITAHDAGQIGDVHYLVMQYAEGRDLNAWIQHYKRIPIPWACEFIRQAALGLEHAHEQGLVHRDIKPANLLVTWPDPDEPPVVKILDLGLARFERQQDTEEEIPFSFSRISDQTDTGITQVGQIVGTPDYLSPEQIMGSSETDTRSDIFSLGCTIFKLLTGQIPYGGKTVLDKIQARIDPKGPPPVSLRSLLPEAPEGLEVVINKMLSRIPEHRYQTPQQVATALQPYSLTAQETWDQQAALTLPQSQVTSISQVSDPSEEDPTLRNFLDHLVKDVDSQAEQPSSIFTHDAPEISDFDKATRPSRAAKRRVARRRVLERRRKRTTVQWIVGAGLFLFLLCAIGLLYLSDPSQFKNSILDLSGTLADPPRLPTWPHQQQGLIFLWENGAQKNGFYDEKTNKLRPCELTARGHARFGRFFDMELEKGSFITYDANVPLLNACKKTNQLTVEVLITSASLDQSGPARIISFSKDGNNRNFTLGQSEDQLIFRLRTSKTNENGTPEAKICRLVPGIPQHILVTYRSGNLVAYLNGKIVYESQLQGDFSVWEPQQLIFGDEYLSQRDWAGRLEGIAIFNRYLTAEEAEQEFSNYHERLLVREMVPQIKLEATLELVSQVRTPEEIKPQERALVAYRYRVKRVTEGEAPHAQIVVLHWAILNGKYVDQVKSKKVGKTYALKLEAYKHQFQLKDELIFVGQESLNQLPWYLATED